MSTTPTTPTTAGWRELADRLTAEQVDMLASLERDHRTGARELRIAAEQMAREQRWERQYANVAPPADATSVGGWSDVYRDEPPARLFRGADHGVPQAQIALHGYQRADGSVRERWIHADIPDNSRRNGLSAGDARAVAAALLAAADALEVASKH